MPKAKDQRRVGDFWTQKAKREDYPARSVFKLQQVDQKYKLLKPGYRVLDLGAAPGAWMKYAGQRVGPDGLVLGLDLRELKVELEKNMLFIKGDVFSEDILQALTSPAGIGSAGPPFDVVLSDLAPATTGIKNVDQSRSLNLAQAAFHISGKVLASGGSFLVKIFQGPEVDAFFHELEACFKMARRIKPVSSRKISPEFFCLGLGFQGSNHDSNN